MRTTRLQLLKFPTTPRPAVGTDPRVIQLIEAAGYLAPADHWGFEMVLRAILRMLARSVQRGDVVLSEKAMKRLDLPTFISEIQQGRSIR